MKLKEQRAAAIKAAQEIIGKAQAGNRSLTSEERAQVEAKQTEITNLTNSIEASEKSEALFKAVGDLGAGGEVAEGGRLSFKGIEKHLQTRDGASNIKALVADGAQLTGTPIVGDIVSEGKPASSLLDLLPVAALQSGPTAAFLRQSTRTNNAAPVKDGDTKATSVYSVEQVEARLQVIAHLTEPMNEYWLLDQAALQTWLRNELMYGLQLALEDQILNGSGTAPNLAGLANTTGVLTAAFETDIVTTTRNAVGQLEVLGYQPSGMVLHPSDWKSVELTKTTDGVYLFAGPGAPVDRAARRLWGVPVALSTQVTVGTGWMLSTDSCGIFTGAEGIRVNWGASGDDFSKNQVRARAEARYALGVTQPSGVVKMTLASA